MTSVKIKRTCQVGRVRQNKRIKFYFGNGIVVEDDLARLLKIIWHIKDNECAEV